MIRQSQTPLNRESCAYALGYIKDLVLDPFNWGPLLVLGVLVLPLIWMVFASDAKGRPAELWMSLASRRDAEVAEEEPDGEIEDWIEEAGFDEAEVTKDSAPGYLAGGSSLPEEVSSLDRTGLMEEGGALISETGSSLRLEPGPGGVLVASDKAGDVRMVMKRIPGGVQGQEIYEYRPVDPKAGVAPEKGTLAVERTLLGEATVSRRDGRGAILGSFSFSYALPENLQNEPKGP